MEAENQKIIENFASLLNGSLKDLHATIIGSISQQQKQLKCMEDHVCSHLASKSDVRKLNKISLQLLCFPCPDHSSFDFCMIFLFQAAQALESRIKKMTEIYTSGVGTLKELANTLHTKASSDMEQIQDKVSSQTLAVENVIELLKNISFFSCFSFKLDSRHWFLKEC